MTNEGKKKLLILGAGPYQLSAIKKAASMGHEVYTVDNVPENPGHKFANRSFNCSTIDKEGVLKIARDLGIDGVCTFASDVAISTVGYINNRLNLNGVSEKAAIIISNKNEFREFQQSNNLPSPKSINTGKIDDFIKLSKDLVAPIIVKPIDASGSKGVTRVDSLVEEKLAKSFNSSIKYSIQKVVCAEEFVHGVEVGGDGFLENGKLAFVAITQKYLDNFIVTGHSFPTNISERDQERVVKEIERTCELVGYSSGPLNFDVMVSEGEVVIIEMSSRNGGNGIPMLIKESYGFDIEVAAIQHALGDKANVVVEKKQPSVSGSYVFGHEGDGVIKKLPDELELKKKIPELFYIYLAKEIGSRVSGFSNNSQMIGYCLLRFREKEDYEKIVGQVKKHLYIELE